MLFLRVEESFKLSEATRVSEMKYKKTTESKRKKARGGLFLEHRKPACVVSRSYMVGVVFADRR